MYTPIFVEKECNPDHKISSTKYNCVGNESQFSNCEQVIKTCTLEKCVSVSCVEET